MIALTEPETIGRIKAVTKEGKWSLRAESVSWRAERVGYYWGTPRLLTLSAIGPDTASSCRAILYSPNVKCEFRVQEELESHGRTWSGTPRATTSSRRACPRSHPPRGHRLCRGLLTDISDAALWRS
jgi:hypothetical protein